ncbi:MAG: 16S rRNA (cytidine(1402)-2'-O)-methyltransferase [Thermodesulfovibrionales bacterium]
MSVGVLYIVATPIGNLEDITLRALRKLKEVDVIAAEDTRHSLKLLNHYGIKKRLISCWSQTQKKVSKEIFNILRSGLDVALITDAGTPTISDPGSYIVSEALKEGIKVIPIPGCSALVTALSVSGIKTSEFTFIGYLPPKRSERIRLLQDISHLRMTLIFYEAPHRLIDMITDLSEVFGNRYIVVAKEMTKIHEEFIRGRASEVIQYLNSQTIAGEYVIISEGCSENKIDINSVLKEALDLVKDGMSRKEASKLVSQRYGLKSKDIYDMTIKR